MKSIWRPLLLLAFLVLAPVLNISGHYINPVEFYLYLAFFLNLKQIKRSEITTIFIRYGVMFTVTILLTSILAQSFINNHDLYILRNCVQLIIALFLFEIYCTNLTREDFESLIFKGFLILSIPGLIVFLQRWNIFNFHAFVLHFYQPKFHSLTADVFGNYRFTSVFKDFFTAAVYFTTLCFSMTVFSVRSSITGRRKIILFSLILFIYIAQLYVARTSLVLIPICCFIAYLLSRKRTVVENIKVLILVPLLLTPAYLIFMNYIKTSDINKVWVEEALSLFSSDEKATQDFSSFEVMQKWNKSFLDYTLENPIILIKPNHVYDMTEKTHPGLYTDSFYPQEIYRYGIYGMIIYAILVLSLSKKFFRENKMLLLLIVLLSVLNYKGGNVFFMPKNVYLYAFLFISLSWYTRKTENA